MLVRLPLHRGADGLEKVGGQLGQRADDLGAAAGQAVGVSSTDQADEAGACGACHVGVASGVADEDDLVSGEAGGSDPRHKLHELDVPQAPTVDRGEPVEQPVPLAELADERRPRAAAQQDRDAGRGEALDRGDDVGEHLAFPIHRVFSASKRLATSASPGWPGAISSSWVANVDRPWRGTVGPPRPLFAADGMRPDLVGRYVAEGAMSKLSSLIAQGVKGQNGLVQAFPPNTGVGWRTLATGTSQGEHGSTNNTFHRTGEGNFNNRTSFATNGILQADHIARTAERAGKSVVSVEGWGS